MSGGHSSSPVEKSRERRPLVNSQQRLASRVKARLLVGFCGGEGPPAVSCSWVGLHTVLCGQASCCLGSFIRLGCPLCSVIEASPHLGFLPVEGCRLCSAISQGQRLESAAGWGCRPGSVAWQDHRLGSGPAQGHRSGSLVMQGQGLCLTAGQGGRLGSLPSQGWRMSSSCPSSSARLPG